VPVSALVALGVVALLRLGRIALRFAAGRARRTPQHGGASPRFPVSAELVPVPVHSRADAGRAPPHRRS
jgi:hypothetical protein